MKNLNKFLGILCIASIFAFTGCSKKSENSSVKNEESKVKITATFYPLYIMLLNICDGIDNVEVSMLAPSNTGCLHDYALTSKDMKKISDCDILVANGSGMEEFMEKAIEVKKDSIIDASYGYELIDENPHVWVSIDGAAYEVNRITKELCRLNPENEYFYNKNAQNYLTKLYVLSNEMHQKLDSLSGSKIITFHEAFPYFAKEFNFDLAAVIERESGTVPSAKELNEIIGVVKNVQNEGGKTALFAEPQYSSSSADIIARETGLKVYMLDPCVTGKLEKDAYIDAMKQNEMVLLEAFEEK